MQMDFACQWLQVSQLLFNSLAKIFLYPVHMNAFNMNDINDLTGEPGLLVGKITPKSPFVGYAGNKQQTEKKRLRDVFVKGDLYFNSGDLLKIDHENFVYFQDRVGDTFRYHWFGLLRKKKTLLESGVEIAKMCNNGINLKYC